MENKIKVEICVDSVESALEAEKGGADRVELCANLMEGGTTPSYASIEIARKYLQIGLHVIIRPRGGDFLYSNLEFEIMKRDLEICKNLGVDGVVIGLLTSFGEIDLSRTAELVKVARPMSVTFHRAFDVTADASDSLERLISLGIDRVLTSGQEATAFEGLETIKKLISQANERITILACGNLTERNAKSFIEKTDVREIHLTGFMSKNSEMIFRNNRVFMGGELRMAEFSRNVTSQEIVGNVCESIK